MSNIPLLIAGLAGLLIGAELRVRGGSNLATRLGVTPIVIGLTVVSIGTSMPELAIGVDAARPGSPDCPGFFGSTSQPWRRLRCLSSSWRGTVFLIASKALSCSLQVSATRS